MSVFAAVEAFFKVGGRKKKIDDAVAGAEKGKKTNKPTLGNPGGTKKKTK